VLASYIWDTGHPQEMPRTQETTMKKLITAAMLATVLTSPAFAQSYDPDIGSGNIAPNYSAGPGYNPDHAAFDRAHGRAVPHRADVDAFARVNDGVVMPDGAVARDPDPNIQFQLNREAEEGEW
jgi:hypothetical protein